MEYTKDIILDVRCKRKELIYKLSEVLKKINMFRQIIYKAIKSNKFISFVLIALVILSVIDIVLVNSFIKLLRAF